MQEYATLHLDTSKGIVIVLLFYISQSQ